MKKPTAYPRPTLAERLRLDKQAQARHIPPYFMLMLSKKIDMKLPPLAMAGDIEHGLIFSRENVYKMKQIPTVREVFDKFASLADSGCGSWRI